MAIRNEECMIDLAKVSLKNNETQGTNNTIMPSTAPTRIRARNERVLAPHHPTNAYIVLGKDRPSTRASGYGGDGATNCGSITLVTGIGSGTEEGPCPDDKVDPNWRSDAATVRVVTLTDIDKDMGLNPGKVGNAKGRSAIGMKADNIRLLARESIKICTLSPDDEPNSRGGSSKTIKGIELNAGNAGGLGYMYPNPDDPNYYSIEKKLAFDYLQPIPLGDNLQSFLIELIDQLSELGSVLETYMDKQDEFNDVVANHDHLPIPPTTGGPVLPNAALRVRKTAISVLQNQQCMSPLADVFSDNIQHLKEKYISVYGQAQPPALPILSPYNKTT